MSLIASGQLFRSARLTFDLGYDSLGVALLDHLLRHLPSHMAAHCLLAERSLASERWAEAQEHFDYVLSVDPVNLRGLRGRGCVALAQGVTDEQNEHLQWAWKLYPHDAETRQLLDQSPDDAAPLVLARVLTAFSRHQEALPYYEAALRQELGQPSEHPVEALVVAEAYWRAARPEEARPLLEILLDQQPTWVRPSLILADVALEDREDAQGVALLHNARAVDASSLVARELFAQNERYSWLIEESLRVPSPGSEVMDGAPAVVRYLLRVDPLPEPFAAEEGVAMEAPPVGAPRGESGKGGKTARPAQTVGEAAPVEVSEEELTREFGMSEPDQNAGVRLILSSRANLVTKYGDDGFEELDAKLADLCEATATSTGHEVMKIYVDDQACLEANGLSRVDPSDPHEIGQLIRGLSESLSNQQKKLKSLLIVGGDAVIPFHRLANPADDDDAGLLSDWPYAAEDGSPLVAKFCVGRLPDGNVGELEVLFSLVQTAIHHHRERAVSDHGVASSTWRNPIRRLFGSGQAKLTSVGYSADVWAEASRAVFEVIGNGKDLRMSPPFMDYDFLSAYERIPTLGYFNLHGFEGSPYWYGHGESDHGTPLLPVALTPLSVSWASAEGAVVYSEACYGAKLYSDAADGSIALSFLASGALAFIGSTAMSYGSLAPPLSGADLLGLHLWEGILDGLPIGYALRRARSSFVRAAAEEQGYLDGEDQKALLSFVLYGDPSLRLARRPAVPTPDADLEVTCPPLAFCSAMTDAESLPLPREVKQKIQRSVPLLSVNGLEAHPLILCRVASSHHECGGKACRASQGSTGDLPELIVASQQKVVRKGGDQLRHVVKVTVNAQGDVLKVMMSRGGTRVREGSKRK